MIHRPSPWSRPFGPVPLVRVTGPALDCGRKLGALWAPELRERAERPAPDAVPIIGTPRIVRLLERHAPALLDLHRGMAAGAGLPESALFSLQPAGPGASEGCSAFAVRSALSAGRTPLSGQTKDTGDNRILQFRVLAVRTAEGFSMLTLTYPGWLFGHGFVAGGCSVFRNSLCCGNPGGRLPYDVWGLLVHACPTVEEARKLTRDEGVMEGFHCVVADEHDGILGIEAGRAGYAFLAPDPDGLYVHTNHALSGPPLTDDEAPPVYGLDGSQKRMARLAARLRAEAGKLTPENAFAALGDHDHYPDSLCSDARAYGGLTTGAVVVDPRNRLLLASRGLPCLNPPTAYRLEGL